MLFDLRIFPEEQLQVLEWEQDAWVGALPLLSAWSPNLEVIEVAPLQTEKPPLYYERLRESHLWPGVPALGWLSPCHRDVSVTRGLMTWGPCFLELQQETWAFPGFSSRQGGAKNSTWSTSWSCPYTASSPECWGQSEHSLVPLGLGFFSSVKKGYNCRQG